MFMSLVIILTIIPKMILVFLRCTTLCQRKFFSPVPERLGSSQYVIAAWEEIVIIRVHSNLMSLNHCWWFNLIFLLFILALYKLWSVPYMKLSEWRITIGRWFQLKNRKCFFKRYNKDGYYSTFFLHNHVLSWSHVFNNSSPCALKTIIDASFTRDRFQLVPCHEDRANNLRYVYLCR